MHRSTHLEITLTQGNRTLVKVKGRGGGCQYRYDFVCD